MTSKSKSEWKIQTEFMNWLRKRAKFEDPKYAHAYHIPNSAKRSGQEGLRYKMAGVVAGVPDVFVGIPAGKYHGLYIEFKTDTGSLSKVQKALHDVIRGNGYYVAVCRSKEEAVKVVEDYEDSRL